MTAVEAYQRASLGEVVVQAASARAGMASASAARARRGVRGWRVLDLGVMRGVWGRNGGWAK